MHSQLSWRPTKTRKEPARSRGIRLWSTHGHGREICMFTLLVCTAFCATGRDGTSTGRQSTANPSGSFVGKLNVRTSTTRDCTIWPCMKGSGDCDHQETVAARKEHVVDDFKLFHGTRTFLRCALRRSCLMCRYHCTVRVWRSGLSRVQKKIGYRCSLLLKRLVCGLAGRGMNGRSVMYCEQCQSFPRAITPAGWGPSQ